MYSAFMTMRAFRVQAVSKILNDIVVEVMAEIQDPYSRCFPLIEVVLSAAYLEILEVNCLVSYFCETFKA